MILEKELVKLPFVVPLPVDGHDGEPVSSVILSRCAQLPILDWFMPGRPPYDGDTEKVA